MAPDGTPAAARGRSRLAAAAYAALGIGLALAVLETLSRADVLPRDDIPPVTDIFSTLWERLSTADFWSATGHTLEGWAIGLAIAVAAAVPLGVLIGSNGLLFRAARPLVEFLRPIPSVALIPLAILIYGKGLEMKVFLIVFAAFWPLLVQTVYGVRDADPLAMDMARSFGLGSPARLVRVTLPSAAPYIATGVRIASSIALILAITAELVVGAPGLGREIIEAQSGGAQPLMYAMIVAAGVLGWGLNSGLVRVERRLLRWHGSNREAPA